MGNIDLFHSRRINFNKCLYWIRDERIPTGNATNWILNNQPSGSFYARQVSNKVNQENQLNNVFMLDKNYITIETDDHVEDISRGCIVKYKNDLYMVESVQSKVHLKESQFSTHEHYTYTISMRK